jgi:predicted permease
MTQLLRDIKYALRGFRKSPVFSAVAVLSLALGIGANTAIFTLVDQLVLRLLPIQDPQRVVLLSGMGRHYGSNIGRNALSFPMYQDLRDRNQVFSLMMCRYPVTPSVGVERDTEVVGGELVSGNYFPLLGIRAAAGRLFTANDDLHMNAHPVAVLSYAWWQSRFAGNPNAIGRTIRVNGFPMTVVGVAQPGFDGVEPGLPAQIFVPISMAPAVRPGFTSMFDRRERWVQVYGRLKPGVSVEQAKSGLQPLFQQIVQWEVTQPGFRNATVFDKEQFLKMWIDVIPGAQGNSNLRRQYERPLWVLTAVVGFVLLIACANLASLLTARAAARQKEIAIRLAIGSSRSRMVRQLLTESLLLSVSGGVAGVGLAMGMVKGLLAFLPSTSTGYGIASSPDYRVLAFAFGISVATGIVFGLVPALQSTRPDIAPTLKDQGGSLTGGGAHIGFRKALVTAQVTLSLLLLIGASLFIRSLVNLKSVDPGFRTGNLIQFRLAPRSAGYDENQASDFYRHVEERLSAIPGVLSAGLADVPVLGDEDWAQPVSIEGYRSKPGEDMAPHFNVVSPGYFDTLGMRLLAGRLFTTRDDRQSPRVVLVNASFVKRYFGNAIAVGRHIGIGTDLTTPTNMEIVGVVNDTRYANLREKIPSQVFLSTRQGPQNGLMVYVRTERDAESHFRAIRASLRESDPGLPIIKMKTLERQLDESLVVERMISTLSSIFGVLATGLAVIGLYGVMAYTVARRAREIGIRIVLGAETGSVVWLVMREVLVLVSTGVLIGLPAAYILSRAVRSELYGIEPSDPASILLATLLLTGVALLAGYIPARRAATYDPVLVLRAE